MVSVILIWFDLIWSWSDPDLIQVWSRSANKNLQLLKCSQMKRQNTWISLNSIRPLCFIRLCPVRPSIPLFLRRGLIPLLPTASSLFLFQFTHPFSPAGFFAIYSIFLHSILAPSIHPFVLPTVSSADEVVSILTASVPLHPIASIHL